ncbi:hypothetical protein C0Q70_12004 [Pomacea canaliculata]|uniref:Uncharacterized protein n=1 Tax=Pomacea canaliculata TaxID=400727 RepID=A0A2T7P0C3_POMCA|nr:hypothetical protein C0Q70_12004 [Pomacea canaliculata]
MLSLRQLSLINSRLPPTRHVLYIFCNVTEDQKRIKDLKMRQFLLWTVFLVLLPLCVRGKRVVFMPSPFTSHTNYHTNVARTLARQGHEVWLTMPDYIVNRRVLDTTNLTVIEYQTLINFEEIMTAALAGNYFKGLPDDWSLLIIDFALYGVIDESSK